jgi:hypothetical protein
MKMDRFNDEKFLKEFAEFLHRYKMDSACGVPDTFLAQFLAETMESMSHLKERMHELKS